MKKDVAELLEELRGLLTEAAYCRACGGLGTHKRGCPLGAKGTPVKGDDEPGASIKPKLPGGPLRGLTPAQQDAEIAAKAARQAAALNKPSGALSQKSSYAPKNWVKKFVDGYIETELWSHDKYDDQGNSDGNFEDSEMSDAAKQEAFKDCKDFIDANWDDLGDLDAAQAGHDFSLTRNRQGAGYWDRGLGDVGKRLTDAAHTYGETHLHVDDGEDEKVDYV